MRPRPLVSLEILLKDCYRQPHFLYASRCRSYTTTGVTNDSGKDSNVAVLGGGITGLATAFYLSKFTNISVTLIEAKSRLGGWLNSTSVDISSGRVVFEQGPRTLRPSAPNGYLTLDLVRNNCCQ
jgi:oxygen-dependent protoporphyrinogen oxidase